MNTVLVVDDEKKFRELISLYLRSEGLNVLEAADGASAIEIFQSKNPDLIVPEQDSIPLHKKKIK